VAELSVFFGIFPFEQQADRRAQAIRQVPGVAIHQNPEKIDLKPRRDNKTTRQLDS
jgi:hypothetical protein